jgi:hypothetical protein
MSSARAKTTESFKWLEGVDSFKLEKDAGKNKIRVKAVWAKNNAVSKNQRHYIGEELKRAARTMIGKAVTVNHTNEKIGNIIWSEYSDDDEKAECIFDIDKQPYVNMIRNKSTEVHGVSMEGNYLYNVCEICGKKFDSNEAYLNHMHNEEFVKNATLEPRGLVFGENALSLVLAPEEPGLDTTLEIMESKAGFMRLCETIIRENSEVRKIEHRATIDPLTGKYGGESYVLPKEAGVGVDRSGVVLPKAEELKLGEPFAGYENHADCVAKNQDKEDPDAYCVTIERNIHDETADSQEIAEVFDKYLPMPWGPMWKAFIGRQDATFKEVEEEKKKVEEEKKKITETVGEAAQLKETVKKLETKNTMLVNEMEKLTEKMEPLIREKEEFRVKFENAEDKLSHYSEFRGHNIPLDKKGVTYTPDPLKEAAKKR